MKPSAEEVEQVLGLLEQYARIGELCAMHLLDCKQCWLADENKGHYCSHGDAFWATMMRLEGQIVDMMPKIEAMEFDEEDLKKLSGLLAKFQKLKTRPQYPG